MVVGKNTIVALKEMGIIVKIYPTDYDTFYKKCWQKEYDRNYHYNSLFDKDAETIAKDAAEWADNRVERKVNDWYNSTELYIEYFDRTQKMIVRKENVKSKEITKDYILKLIDKDKKLYVGTYGEFTETLQKLAKLNGWNGWCIIYPTTYGIGILTFYNFHFDENKNTVTELLKNNDIEYKNEFSDKGYVYRYKISKAKNNLHKLKSIS